MVHEAVAQRYALALFQLGQQGGKPAKLLDDLVAVGKTLDQHPALARALQAPNVPDTVKKAIANQLFGQGNPIIHNLLYLLIDKGREAYVVEIARQYRKLLDESVGTSDAEVETAVPMSDTVKRQFARTLGEQAGRKFNITWRVNPDLIGGYVLRQGDRMLDRSFRHQFSTLQHRLQGT